VGAINIPTVVGAVLRDNVASGDIHPLTYTGGKLGRQIYVNDWFAADHPHVNDHWSITIDGNNNEFHLYAAEVVSSTTLANKMVSHLNDYYPHYESKNNGDHVEIWSPVGDMVMADITVSKFFTPGASITELVKERGFKTGANQPFCIYYYDDNMRRWDAQVTQESTKVAGTLEYLGTTCYVPMFNELAAIPANTAYKFTIDWEVYHLPPAGATYWRWGFAGNSLCNYMVQYIIKDIVDTTATDGLNMCQIDITPLQTLTNTTTATWNQYPTSVILPYAWEKGDRVRFITQTADPSAPGTLLGNIIDGVYDFEILKQDGTDSEYIYVQHFDYVL
jgi:hypothetical protein